MWHKCLDGKWTHNSNISIQPNEIPFFINTSTIDCVICAYSEYLFLNLDKQNDNTENNNNQNENENTEDKKVSLKSLARFVKRIQKYEQKYQPKKVDTGIETSLKIHTDRIDSSDKDKLDVTRKSASRFGMNFAPSWEIINKAKKEEINFDTFKLLYIEEMKKSYVENNAAWVFMLMKDRVVLTCYCTDHEHCHRTVLARDILPLYGAKYVGELSRESDLSDSSKIQDQKNIVNQKEKKNSKKSSGNNGQGSLF